jgi:hypothetical protein
MRMLTGHAFLIVVTTGFVRGRAFVDQLGNCLFLKDFAA